jgi:streptogramin lyase
VALAAGSGSVWWIDRDGGTVTRVDPSKNEAAGSPVRVGENAGGGAVTQGTLWVTSPTADSLIRVRF